MFLKINISYNNTNFLKSGCVVSVLESKKNLTNILTSFNSILTLRDDEDDIVCDNINDVESDLLIEKYDLRGGSSSECWMRRFSRGNLIHRDFDKPAVIQDRVKMWYYRGLLHRDDGPAMEYIDGTNRWFKHGCSISLEKIDDLKKMDELYLK